MSPQEESNPDSREQIYYSVPKSRFVSSFRILPCFQKYWLAGSTINNCQAKKQKSYFICTKGKAMV